MCSIESNVRFQPGHWAWKAWQNTKCFQKRLQEEFLKSEYFDPSSFLGSMEKLPKMMLKVICCRERTEDSDTILDLLTSSILFAQQLTNAGYNKNVKKKTEKEFKECCIYLDPMDDKVELLRKIICGHLFYSRCVNKWFEDKETHKYLICPMWKDVDVFANVRDT